jgi:hypothetical protein
MQKQTWWRKQCLPVVLTVVPSGGFSSFLLCFCFSSVCLCFFASSASSHSTGLLSITGREAAAGSGSRVALAAAAWGADSEEGKVYDDAGPLGWFLVLKKVEVDDGGGFAGGC